MSRVAATIPVDRRRGLFRVAVRAVNVQFIAYVFACCLPIFTAFVIYHIALPVPFWDEWSWADLIYRQHLGNLHFSDIWIPHNEHRMLFPNAAMLGLAMLGGWNQLRETFFSLLLVVITQIGLFVLLRRVIAPNRLAYAFLAVSLLLYSLAQMENWDWGFEMGWFICNVCAVWALVFIGAAGQSWFALGAAGLLAMTASFSGSQGLMVWFGGAAALALTEKRNPSQIAGWAILTVVAFGLYFHDFPRPPGQADPLLGIHHPLTSMRYFGAYFGALFAGWTTFAAAVTLGWLGLVALFLLVGLVAIDYRTNRFRAARAGGFIGLAVYALATAAITTMGRVGFGEAQAEASRYSSISIYCWITIFALCIAYEQQIRTRLPENLVALWPAAVVTLGVLYVGADRAGYALGAGRLALVQSAYAAMIVGHGPELGTIYPAEAPVEAYLKELRLIADGPYYH